MCVNTSVHMIARICMCVCVFEGVFEADLSRRFHTSDETEENDKPGNGQATQDRETDLSKVPNIIRNV